MHTCDTDVVTLAISCIQETSDMGLEKLWGNIGTGKNREYIAAHEITWAIGMCQFDSTTNIVSMLH